MKYLPTINLWSKEIQDALLNGNLKLQTGQWVQCGNSKPSRFVGVNNNKTIWAAHPSPYQNEQFKSMCKSFVKHK